MTSSFKVLKYDCTSCAMVMEGICEDTEGVTKAAVNARTLVLTIEHEDSVDLAEVAKTLASEGYPVERL